MSVTWFSAINLLDDENNRLSKTVLWLRVKSEYGEKVNRLYCYGLLTVRWKSDNVFQRAYRSDTPL